MAGHVIEFRDYLRQVMGQRIPFTQFEADVAHAIKEGNCAFLSAVRVLKYRPVLPTGFPEIDSWIDDPRLWELFGRTFVPVHPMEISHKHYFYQNGYFFKEPDSYEEALVAVFVGTMLDSHPNFVRVQGLYSQDDHHYVVSEYHNAPTFRSFLRTRPVSNSLFLTLVLQVILAIAEVAERHGFTHHDLHADNVLVCTTEEETLRYSLSGTTQDVTTHGYILKIIDCDTASFVFEGRRYQAGRAFDGQINVVEPFFDYYNLLFTQTHPLAKEIVLEKQFSSYDNSFDIIGRYSVLDFVGYLRDKLSREN